MMQCLNNYLTSGYRFSEDESLQKFRFMFINTFFLLAVFTGTTNLMISLLGLLKFGFIFETACSVFLVTVFIGIYLLRKSKSYYRAVIHVFLASTLALYYLVLLTRQEDEFRLIAFFMAIYMAYVFVGKRYGMFTSIFIMISIPIIDEIFFLGISSIAYSTFYSFFFSFSLFFYLFFHKVESDSSEFKFLNNKLKEKAKQETAQRVEQEQMLLRQYRMANMGEMLDSIAHQWRQPLMHINSVLLNMESALEAEYIQEGRKGYFEKKIDEVSNLTKHMSQTIEDFRGLFQVGKELKEFTLKGLFDDVQALLKNNLNDIRVECTYKDNVSVLSYRSELIQVIIIILSNSIEALRDRKITNKEITISAHSSNNSAIISIEDNAEGIKLDNIDIIFDPYYTAKEQSGGTGLGLYIAKIIVEHNLGGKIVASNTSAGAKFTISLSNDFAQRQFDEPA